METPKETYEDTEGNVLTSCPKGASSLASLASTNGALCCPVLIFSLSLPSSCIALLSHARTHTHTHTHAHASTHTHRAFVGTWKREMQGSAGTHAHKKKEGKKRSKRRRKRVGGREKERERVRERERERQGHRQREREREGEKVRERDAHADTRFNSAECSNFRFRKTSIILKRIQNIWKTALSIVKYHTQNKSCPIFE